MTKLKLAGIDDDKPVKVTVALPAALHRNLAAYAELLAKETGKPVEPAKLIAPMLEKFIAGDKAFSKARRSDLRPRAQGDAAGGTSQTNKSTQEAQVPISNIPLIGG